MIYGRVGKLEFLTDWIQQLIVVILLAIIAEMLLPDSKWRNYTKVVISLIIILICLQPVFTILNLDMNSITSAISINNKEEPSLKQKIDGHSSEIDQAKNELVTQQVTKSMKEQVADDLASKYNLAIDSVVISGEGEEISAAVSLGDIDESKIKSIEALKPVSISVNLDDENMSDMNEEGKNLKNQSAVVSFLAENWGIEEKDITITYIDG